MLLVAALATVMALPPIAQDPTCHGFADRRGSPAYPFFSTSSIPRFWPAGIAGIMLCVRGSGALQGAPTEGQNECKVVIVIFIALPTKNPPIWIS